MKSDVYQRMDRMIENLKLYRADFRVNRVPTFLMSKQQLSEHRRKQREKDAKARKGLQNGERLLVMQDLIGIGTSEEQQEQPLFAKIICSAMIDKGKR